MDIVLETTHIVPVVRRMKKNAKIYPAPLSVKAKTKPIPGGKISKKNLMAVGLGIYTC